VHPARQPARIEVHRIGFVKAHQVAGEGVDFIGWVFADQMLVQAL
jgi:hypothetical protein